MIIQTEIKGFDNPRAQLNWDDLMAEYLLDKQKSYLATIESGKEEVDFTMTFYGFCIVSEKFANILAAEKISDCLIVPLSFDNELSQKYYLLVDPLRYDCVDERNSDFEKFLENDPVRPDLAGRYKAFFKLIINASKADCDSKSEHKRYL